MKFEVLFIFDAKMLSDEGEQKRYYCETEKTAIIDISQTVSPSITFFACLFVSFWLDLPVRNNLFACIHTLCRKTYIEIRCQFGIYIEQTTK